MKSFLVTLAALCLATIALADPAKPNPPTDYSLSAFAITPSGYVSVNTYYDQTNQRARSDIYDTNFNQVGEFIGLYESNQGYWYDSASGQCTTWALNSPWINAWDFLNDATFAGVDEYYPGKQCDLWLSQLGDDITLAACFTDDYPVFLGLYNGTQVNSIYFVTNFVGYVDPDVFSLPSTCSSSFKLSAGLRMMNLKKFKVPAHPLLF